MDLKPDARPLDIFTAWMAEAKADPAVREATAMTVATQGPGGELHARVVLCKEWTDEGFFFYSNYHSQKGRDLEADPEAAAVFYWDPLFRQVRVVGRARRTSREISERYWNSRPRASQISGFVSHQSAPVASREALTAEWAETERRFAGRPIPCPPHWGGYVLEPRRIEFWFGQPNRLHDRFEFEKTPTNWTFRRLSP